MNPRLVVIAGPNGSGKTSITAQLRELRHKWMLGCEYINPDDIARERFGDWNDPAAVLSAAKFADALRERFLAEKRDFAFETVLSTDAKVDFLKRAHNAGFFIRLFFVGTDHPGINASRIISRMEDGGHAVPIEKILSRYGRSMKNALRVARFADRAYFYDNSVEAELGTTPNWIPLFRTENGKVVSKYAFPQTHAWAAAIYNALEK